MTFEIDTTTKARLSDVIVLSQKNRLPDENPGAKLSFEIDLPNRYLSCFDIGLLGFLFCKNANTSSKPKQGTLDGVEPVSDLPDLTSIGAKVGVLNWEAEFTGYRLLVDQGLGGKKSNLEVDEGTISNIRIKPKNGGTFQLKCDFESPNVSETTFGRLAKLKSREIEITLTAPEVDQRSIDAPSEDWPFPGAPGEVVDAEFDPNAAPTDSNAPKLRRVKAKDATSAFVEAHAGSAS